MTADDETLMSWHDRLEVLQDSGDVWDSEAIDEVVFWPRVLWIDPGVVSGWACVWFDPAAVLRKESLGRCALAWCAGQLSGDENTQIAMFHRMALSLGHGKPDWAPGLVVGSESFTVRSLNMSQEFLAPVRIAAALNFLFWRRGKRLQMQSPSEAKTTMPDARLKLWRMYTPGPDHARDATRHALLWVKKLSAAGMERFLQTHASAGNEEGWWRE